MKLKSAASVTRRNGMDEAGTLSRLNVLRRELINPTIAANSGRLIKLMGDGALVEFTSAVDAVSCAIDIQRRVKEHESAGHGSSSPPIQFRIGVNVGDIIIEGDDILGDGANIAARIEGVAEPGGISIFEDTWRQVKCKVPANFLDTGEQNLKNIDRPVRVFQVELAPKDATGSVAPRPQPVKADTPSIAVLAFYSLLITSISKTPSDPESTIALRRLLALIFAAESWPRRWPRRFLFVGFFR